MPPKSGTLGTIRIVGLAMFCCASVSISVGCAQEGGVKSGTGGQTGTGGATGSGGAVGSGGTTGSGGVVGSGGTPGAGGVLGTGGAGGGATGTGGDTSGTGGAGGMAFLVQCDIVMNTDSVFNAATASNAGLITDFPFAGGATGFGDLYNSVSGVSFVGPAPVPPVPTGGAGGGAAGGAGGRGGAGGAGGRGGAGGAGGRGGAGGAGGRGGAGGAGGAPLGNPGLTGDLSANNWHIAGTISNAIPYDLARVGFRCIVDASAYTGVQFTIGGNPGPAGSLTLQAGIAGDEPGSFTTPGQGTSTCLPGGCQYPFTTLTVPATVLPAVTTVQLPWNRFTGGRPIATVDPHQLIQFLWTWNRFLPAGPYNVDVTIDDLRFYTAPVDSGVAD